MSSKKTDGPATGPISAHEVYPLAVAMARMGIGRAAYRSAVQQGLRPIRKLNRTFLLGSELIRFLSEPSK